MRLKSLLFGLFFTVGSASSAFGAWQPETQFDSNLSAIAYDGATDGNGNAIAIWSNSALNIVQSSYYTNGSWGATQTVSTPASRLGSLSLAMDATGGGLALWVEDGTNNIKTAFFSAGNPSTPLPDPLSSITGFPSGQSVAMNGSGLGVGAWVNSGTSTVNGAFFSAGAWGPVSPIGTGTSNVILKYNPLGTAFAIWDNAGVVTANFSIAGVWQVPTPLGTSPNALIDIGSDANGNAIAAWIDGSGAVITSTFNGAIWLPSQMLAAGPGNFSPSLAVAPGGTAVLTWIDAVGNGFVSTYDGSSWTAPILYASDLQTDLPLSYQATVSVDSDGNALIVYNQESEESGFGLYSIQIPVGGALQPPLMISPGFPLINYVISALSSDGVGFAFWLPSDESVNPFASVLLPFPAPPGSISGRVCQNKFATQSDRVHIISWTASDSPGVTSYYIRRNGVLIGIVPATAPLVFYDHNRSKNVTDVYQVTAVDSEGGESDPLTIALK